MKKLLALCMAICIGGPALYSQAPKISASLLKKLDAESMSQARYAEKEISLFVTGDLDRIRQSVTTLGGTYKYTAGNIAAIRMPLRSVRNLAAETFVRRIEDNDLHLQHLNDQVEINSHALEVHNGWNLPQAYDGSHVVVGIIDEGIDFTHPDFRNTDGTTRIKYLWDQTIDGNVAVPQPFGYGKEFIGSQIDTSTEHFDAVFSHGSHVTGIACGNGMAMNNYKGVAPGADIVIVKMNLSVSDDNFLSNLVDAVRYVYDRADSLGEPAVINVSLGTYFGSHDARDIQAQAIESIITSKNGRAMVCAGGNLGNAPIHLGYNASSDTAMTWLQYSSSSIYFQVWGDSSDFENVQLSMGIDRVRPDYSLVDATPFSNVLPYVGMDVRDTMYNSAGQRLGIVRMLGDYRFGSYLLEFSITADSTLNISGTDTTVYRWRFRTTGSGRLDAWGYDMVFDNLPDSVTFPPIRYYHRPDLDQNIVSSFSCSDKVITVGAFTNRNFYTNVNFTVTSAPSFQVGQLWVQSSHGPTRDLRIKPDIVAAGDWVLSCGTHFELPLLAAVDPSKVAAGGKHKRSSGTSMSSPVVCGIGALYFQRFPNASWSDFKNAVLGCAERDAFTGNNLPDNIWGYGKANAYNTVRNCLVGIPGVTDPDASISIFPNPVSDAATIRYEWKGSGNVMLQLVDATGRTVRRMELQGRSGELRFDRTGLESGVYLYSLIGDGAVAANGRLVIL